MNDSAPQSQRPDPEVPASLDELQASLQLFLGDSSDVVYRNIAFRRMPGLIVYIEGMADPRHVIEALLEAKPDEREDSPERPYETIRTGVITEGQVNETDSLEEVCGDLLGGATMIYMDGCRSALLVSTKSLKQRAVQEATSQSVVRGPREGFTEDLVDNIALVRRRIQHPSLRIRKFKIGTKTRTLTAVMYMEGKADPAVLSELYARLERIKLESVLESSYIEEAIQDERYSPFPTVYNSERPDVIASAVLEGRIAILVDGTPFVLVVPALFVQFFQSSEDYYQRSDFSSMVRLLRYFCFAISLLTPSVYVAVTTYHQEMIPPPLLISLIGQREGIPFPAFVEALIMEITFEVLREAGIRLPKSIGQSVSIVGTLVIGQAAVEAGFISAAMVIVVSLTAIANFALPAFNVAISIRMLRFALMAAAAMFGLFGVMVAMIMLALHLSSLESMGVPYMSSLAPFKLSRQKDTLLRLPRFLRLRRSGRS
ncbi:spore germination protein [Cohnella sp. CIP 111063]|uniref:spore germination protein n=1 Tax=unclassified Cohnella TaxID=2636738 RepID=UPI000B8C3DE4|nr:MULTISPECIES: spore germination protein [unclassified Cohnella]OXS54282.1 spore germination protein [Cohnella sp. CIP 111063]PRX63477.1 spore germination protein KA [Cohnella sp. SGD-V74]